MEQGQEVICFVYFINFYEEQLVNFVVDEGCFLGWYSLVCSSMAFLVVVYYFE